MSHEFKTPLTGIQGALELLMDHGETMHPAERRRFLDNAMADSQRLSRLVARLLDLSRAELAIATDNLHCDIVAVARDFVAQTTAPDLPIELNAPDRRVTGQVLPETLRSVLATLTENSRQAGARNVRIEIEAHETQAAIDVIDDGEGVPQADRDRIFEAFFTSRRAEGGTGLGLPIAASLLSVTGATLSLIPAKQGTRFRIVVPRSS